MRLIDADDLVKHLTDWRLQECPVGICDEETETYKTICECIEAVKAQPTAYDTERVVERLERKKEQCEKDCSYWADRSAVDSCIYNECDLFGSKADLLEETIEIVRKGGAE